MTNEELLAALRAAITEAIATAVAVARASAAGAAAGVGSVAAAQGEGTTGTGARRTVSDVEAADRTDISRGTVAANTSLQTKDDIGGPEAWEANVKRTYDVHQTDERESFARNRLHFDRLIGIETTHVANLNQLTVQALANNGHGANLLNLQAAAHRDIAIDREWNVNATDLAEKSAAVLTDKVLSKVAVKAQ